MTIKTSDGKVYDVILKLWDGNGWSPDCFGDLAAGDLRCYPHDDGGSPVMQAGQLADMVSWWEEETANANRGVDGDGLQGLTPEQIDRGYAWCLVCSC